VALLGPAIGCLVVAMSVATGTSAAATGVPAIHPRAGAYAGTESGPAAGAAITFTVAKNRTTIRHLSGRAATRKGCHAPYIGFALPAGPVPIGRKGAFVTSSTLYPGPKVRVTLTGRFTSPTRATGHIVVRFARVKGCNATSAFIATRTGSPGGSAPT
jgi:hypothetical protein